MLLVPSREWAVPYPVSKMSPIPHLVILPILLQCHSLPSCMPCPPSSFSQAPLLFKSSPTLPLHSSSTFPSSHSSTLPIQVFFPPPPLHLPLPPPLSPLICPLDPHSFSSCSLSHSIPTQRSLTMNWGLSDALNHMAVHKHCA